MNHVTILYDDKIQLTQAQKCIVEHSTALCRGDNPNIHAICLFMEPDVAIEGTETRYTFPDKSVIAVNMCGFGLGFTECLCRQPTHRIYCSLYAVQP